jgi:hypothetical protein
VFGKADFAAMARALHDLEGRFVLSLNDVPEVRQAFDGFRFVDRDGELHDRRRQAALDQGSHHHG